MQGDYRFFIDRFLNPEALIPRTGIRVQDARDGNFEGSEIPADLKRQWFSSDMVLTCPRASSPSNIQPSPPERSA